MEHERSPLKVLNREDPVERIRWMLTGKSGAEACPSGETSGSPLPSHPKSTLNGSRLILDSVGESLLANVVGGIVELLGSSCAVFERNGDYALSLLPGGWCRFMHQASRARCGTEDNGEAMASGRWHCHESCWKEAALRSMATHAPVDVACRGGIRLFAVPILAGSEIIGSISVGYGDPPREREDQEELATAYGVSPDDLRRQAEEHDLRPAFVVEMAKKQVCSAARTLGEIVERSRRDRTLLESMEHLPVAVFIKDQESRVLFANRYLRELFNWQDCVGKTTQELLPQEVAERMVADDRRALAEGPRVIQERVVDRNGVELFFDTHKFPIQVEGATTLLAGIAVDVTARKRSEDALENRILALTQPQEDMESVSFEDLFNLTELQRLQDLFADVWGVAALITRPDGTPITRPSNFTYFCSEFIRKSEKGRRNCEMSDATLGRHDPSGPIIQACLSAGLWGAGASITVGGRHIGSWLIGQVRNDAQTPEQVLEYARKIGVDEAAFLEAFLQVPVMPQKTFEQIAHSLFALANQLSNTAYQNIQQARFIADRRRAEEALRESETRFRGIYEASPIGIEIYDLDGALLGANRACLDIFGISDAAAVKGFRLFEDPNLTEELKRQLLSGEGVRYELPFDFGRVRELGLYETTRSGVIHLDLSITPLRDGTGGSGIGYLVHVQDITERKAAEEALRESEARYSAVVRQAQDGVLIVQDDVIRFANQSLGNILGYEYGAMLNTSYLEYVAPEHRALIAKRVKERFEGKGPPSVYEARLLHRDGTVIDVELSASIIQYHGKAADVCIIRDITERKRVESERRKFEIQMREVQKLESLGILAGGIAHDFNNLLMAILGNADLALLSLSPVSPARNHLEEIMRASHRASDLCRQMLAYSGKGRFVVSHHDLSEIVREMGQMLDVSISKKAIMRYSLAENLPAVEADATQMRQVIMNLITNASEAMADARGVITVTTGVMECDEAYLSDSYLDDRLPGGAYVYLEVSDTGCGMDAEAQRRIFDPFFTTKFTGRGLGLAAVLGIVRGHKGAIKVYSEIGIGTTFKILLPAVAWEPGERTGRSEQTVPLQGSGTVLLVDDEVFVRTVASAMLTELGFRVLTADNGREAVEIFRVRSPEITCVVLDLMMPEMGGEETFRELRRIRSDVPVILSSGYNEQDVTQRFVGRGLSGFIQKPYTIAGLRAALTRTLG